MGEGQTKGVKPRAASVSSGNNLMFAPRSFARVSQSYAEDRRLATGIGFNVSLAYTRTCTCTYRSICVIYAYIMIIPTVGSR